MTPKELVKSYYDSDFANEKNLLDRYLHQDCTLNWHSSKGFNALKFNDLQVLYDDMNRSYSNIRVQISHMFQEDNVVTTRYTLYVTPLETPDEEQPMAHFITIWELKDGKLYNGYEISQLADASAASLNTF